MKALLRGTLATLVGSVSLFVASSALAEGEACYNDIDCPGTACGDAVCNWSKQTATPVGKMVFACNPAGSQPARQDGWCTTDADCKCAGQGAVCKAPYCTFTKPMAGAGGTGAGGVTGTAGSATTAGTGTAGTPAGGTGSKPAAEESSACSMSVPGGVNTGLALGVGLLGLAFARRRR